MMKSLLSTNPFKIPQSELYNVKAALEQVENGFMDVDEAADAFLGNASEEARILYNNSVQAGIGANDLGSGMEKAGLSALAAKAGIVALNAAVSIGISLLASFAISAVSDLIHAEERLHESVSKIVDSFNEQNKKLQSGKAEFQDLAKRYDELSKGVNGLGENVSLSSDEFDEYHEVANKIAEQFPDMIQGFDEQGNAIIKSKENVESLTKAYNDLISVQNNEILSKSVDVYKDFANTVNKIENPGFFSSDPNLSTMEALKELVNSRDIEKTINDILGGDIGLTDSIVGLLEDNGFEYFGDYLDFDKMSSFILDAIQRDQVGISSIVNTYFNQFKEAIDGVAADTSAYVSQLFLTDFSNVSPQMQAAITKVISGLDFDFYDQFKGDPIGAHEYLREYIAKFAELDENTIGVVFDLQTKFNNNDCSLGDYISGVNGVRDAISKEFEDDEQKQIMLSFDLDEDDLEEQYNKIISIYRDHWSQIDLFKNGNEIYDESAFQEWLNSLSNEEFQAAAKISLDPESVEMSLEEWQNAVENAQIPETAIQTNEEFAKSLSGIAKIAKDLSDGYSLIAEAQKEMESGDGLSGKTLQSLQSYLGDGEDISTYIFSDENGKLQLNIDLWKQRAEAMMQSETVSIEGRIAELKAENALLANKSTDPNDSSFATIVANQEEIDELEEKLIAIKAVYNDVVKDVESNPLDLSTMFGEIGTIHTNADSIIKAMDTLRNGATLTYDELYALAEKYPELMQIDGFLDLDTAESQMGALQGVMDKYESEFSATVQKQIDILLAAKEGLDASDETAKAIDGVVANLKDISDDGLGGLFGSDASKSLEETIAKVQKASSLIKTVQEELNKDGKNSVDAISSLMSMYGDRWQEFVQYADDGSFTISIEKIKADIYSLVDAAEDTAPQFKDALKETLNIESEETDFKSSVDKYVTDIKSLSESLKSIRSGDFTASDMYSLIAKFPTLARNTKDLDSAIVNLMKSLDSDIMAQFDIQMGDISTEAQREEILGLIETVQALRDELSESFDFQTEFDNLKTSLDSVTTAIDESNSSAGLSADSVEKLTERYKDLKGFKPEELFEKTENGIRLNTEKLQELEAEYEKMIKAKYQDELEKLVTEYNNLSAEIDNCSDSAKQADLYANRQDIKDQIEDIEVLIARYDGLTSKLSNYERAKSSKDQGYGYDLVASDFEHIQELRDQGYYGKDEFIEYLNLFSRKDLTGASNAELERAYKKAERDVQRYFIKDSEDDLSQNGVIRFLEDLRSKGRGWATTDKNGNWSINIDPSQYADLERIMNMPLEEVEAILRKSEEYGLHINFDSLYAGIELVGTKAEQAAGKLKLMGKTDVDFNFATTDIDDLNTQIDAVEKTLEKFKGSDGQIDLSIPGAEEAQLVLDTLIDRKKYLTDKAAIDVDTTFLNDAAEKLKKLGLTKYKIDFDVTNVDRLDEEIADAQAALDTFRNTDGTINIDAEGAQEARAVLAALIEKRQKLQEPTLMKVDASNISGEVGEAIRLLQDYYSTKNTIEIQTAVGADTSEAEQQLNTLVGEISGKSPEVLAQIGIKGNVTPSSIETAINDLDPKVVVGVDDAAVDTFSGENHDVKSQAIYTVKDDEVQKYKAPDKSAHVNYLLGETPNYNPPDLDRYLTYHVRTVGSAGAAGTAHAQGTAFKNGDWGTKDSGVALGGELGQELIVRDGKFFTIGDYGAEFFKYKKGDIIFNANQTKEIFEKGKIRSSFGRGKVYADGTAFYSGSGSFMRSGRTITKPTKPTKTNTRASSSPSSSYSNPTTTSSNTNTEEEIKYEAFDWIEVAISRIELLITNLGRTAESAFKSLSKRLSASKDEIAAIRDEIDLQNAGYERYLQEAASVNLNAGIKAKVREGTIDINEYDEETRELISDYKEWYDKALECADAVDELNQKISELYKGRFDSIKSDFDNQISLLEHLTTTYSNSLSIIEERGLMGGASLYQEMINVEKGNLYTLNNELKQLTEAMQDAVDSGEIEAGSEAWYEMYKQINSVKQAIQESELAVVKYGNSIRDLDWKSFDYLEDSISRITDESEFLIKLMDTSKLFTDEGQFTNTGMAQLGLTAMNYDVYMAQASKYAEEIKKLNAEIVNNDPYNTKLIDRRNELLSLQRKAILSAESEKQAVASLVEKGIKLELDSFKKLTDSYTKNLEAAKDLHDYQKKIKEQTKNIASLEKQIAAYQGDNSEENRARIQKLKVDYSAALEDLQETEYEKYIKDQKRMIDEMYENYERTLNARLDDVDALMEEMINVANENSELIDQTIQEETEDVGYTLTENMADIWKGYGDKLSHYGDNALTGMSSIRGVLSDIESEVSAIVSAGNSAASSTISNTSYRVKGDIFGYSQGGYISDIQKIVQSNGDDILTINSLKKGEAVLTPTQTKQFERLIEHLPQLQGIEDISAQFNSLRNIGQNSGTNIGQVTYDTDIHLEGITDYNDFMTKMKNDDKFERMLLDMTVNRLNGQSTLAKKKYSW